MKENNKKQKDKRNYKNNKKQKDKRNSPTISKSVSLSGPEINDGVDASWVAAVNQELAKAPANVLQAFTNSGWSFHVTPMNIDAVYFGGQYGSVMGVTVYEEIRRIKKKQTSYWCLFFLRTRDIYLCLTYVTLKKKK